MSSPNEAAAFAIYHRAADRADRAADRVHQAADALINARNADANDPNLPALRDDRDHAERARDAALAAYNRAADLVLAGNTAFRTAPAYGTGHRSVLPFSDIVVDEMNGIALESSKNVERRELVGEVMTALGESRHVLLSAPPAYGKTSLIQLLHQQHSRAGIVAIERVSLIDGRHTAQEIVLEATGIDVMAGRLPTHRTERLVIIALDESQMKYEAAADLQFWHRLLKDMPPANQHGAKFRFLISATDYIKSTFVGSSPASFSGIKRFDRERLRLTDAEAAEVYDKHIRPHLGRDHMPSVRSVILNAAAGHVGLIRLSTMSLNEQFKTTVAPDVAMRDIFSTRFMSSVDRCFGSIGELPLEVIDQLRRHLLEPRMQFDVNSKPIISLMRCGYLIMNYDGPDGLIFASPMAKRFACARLFPGRADMTTAPKSLPDLICAIMSGMSADLINTSSQPAGRFPVETAWQHLFMAGLAHNLPPGVAFVPELACLFPHNDVESQNISGAIDFYVNGDRRWGIELLVKGDRLGEHLARFEKPSGKYVPLAMTDYRVVDIRPGTPTPITRHTHRTTVWFPPATDDNPCRVCFIQDGNDEPASFPLPP